jgi:DNA polymerase IV
MAKDNSKRRKRKELSFPLVPEGGRFFLGMTFYSIPPDDASDIRRLRIAKARSFGAIWTKEWIPGVITHVVIEKGLTYEDVIKWFKSEHKVGSLIFIS